MDFDKLYDIAIGALARRDYSAKQLTLFLKSHCNDDDKVSQIISRLSDHNYLNDGRLLEREINKYLAKQYGQSRIQQELRRKGFNDTDIGLALEGLETDWLAMAQDLKNKKFGTAKPADPKDKAKQIRYLQYKGHAMSDIMALIR